MWGKMTERLYYDDPYLLCFEARVCKTAACEGGQEIWLDRSAFYPTSGGQPYDTGTIGGRRVVNVEVREGDVVHTIEGELREGENVICRIDEARRKDHMQQHCAEHMLAFLIYKHYDGFTHGLHIGEEFSSIDVTMPDGRGHLTDGQIIALEEEWNEWIQRDEEVRCFFPSDEELAALPMRKESSVKEHIRIVHIAPDEYVACGGTHPARTGEIGCARILETRPSRGKMRVSFVCGMRAVRDNRRKSDQCLAAAQKLSANWEELAQSVDRINEKCAALSAKMHGMQRKMAAMQMEALLAKACLSQDGRPVLCAAFSDMDIAAAREAAGEIVGREDCYALIAAQGDDGAALCFVRGPHCTQEMGRLLNETARACGGKGGGRADFAQGFAPDANAALEFARGKITAQPQEGV